LDDPISHPLFAEALSFVIGKGWGTVYVLQVPLFASFLHDVEMLATGLLA